MKGIVICNSHHCTYLHGNYSPCHRIIPELSTDAGDVNEDYLKKFFKHTRIKLRVCVRVPVREDLKRRFVIRSIVEINNFSLVDA